MSSIKDNTLLEILEELRKIKDQVILQREMPSVPLELRKLAAIDGGEIYL